MKRQEDITLSLNFEEADAEDHKSVRLFRDHAKRRFLIGFIPEKTKAWIEKNKL